MARIPSTLLAFSLFADGRGLIGVVNATLPVLAMKTEETRPGGFDAAVDVTVGMEKLTCELEFDQFEPELDALFNLADTPFTLRGSHSDPLLGEIGDIVNMRGTLIKSDPGQWAVGPKSKHKAMLTLTYYKRTYNFREMAEIDVVNQVRVIDGVDQLARRRANLGQFT